MEGLPTQLVGMDHEVWENASLATLVVKKVSTLGQVTEERIPPGRKIQLTPRERQHNQEQFASDDYDFFKNGNLRPVKLLDDQPDTPVLQANLNAMSESAMRSLYKERIASFRSKLEEISNPRTLERLIEIGSEEDASIKQIEAVHARLTAVRPALGEVEPGRSLGSAAPEGHINPVTPM